VSFEVQASSPRPFSELQKIIGGCADLLSIASGTYCAPNELTLVPAAAEDKRTRSGTFHALPFYRNRRPPSRLLFRFADIEARAATLYSTWLSKLDALADPRALYIWGLYGRAFVEHKLLALTQAAEAYHRRTFPDRYVDQGEFQTSVFAPLTAAIPAGTDAFLRDAIVARLKFANEHSLRRRLRTLFRAHAPVLRLVDDRAERLIDPIVDTRNAFTHFPAPSSGPAGTRRAHSQRVLLYNWTLQVLLESCFLTEMGLPVDEVAGLVESSSRYRQMSARLHELNI
jgi:hypothetical protein